MITDRPMGSARSLSAVIQRMAFLIGSSVLVASASAQFVTLEGRTFMLEGEEFYPRVMNYGLQLTTSVDQSQVAADIYITPEGGYDRDTTSFFECTSPGDCLGQIQAHFEKIVSMGFNTVRLVNIAPFAYRDSSGTDFYRLQVYPNFRWHPDYTTELDVATFADSMSVRLFTLIRDVLDEAELAGLKVILLTGTEVRPTGPGMPGHIAYTQHDAELYADYLEHLAAALQDHPALLAYDLMNEPAWRPNDFNGYGKATACDWTSLWYDRIKQADPDHLVTLGGMGIGDLHGWDMGVMKLDFYSPHVYPQPLFIDDYDLANAQKRYDAELYWLAKASPMPWLIGETGFTADDDTTCKQNEPGWTLLTADPLYHRMPWMNGSEHDQAVFAKRSMDQVRAFQGSGYAWWGFQNGLSPRESAIQENDPGRYSINFLAVLGYGDGVDPWRNKKVVDSCLVSYVLPPAPATLPEPPEHYYNWLGATGDVTYTAHVQDQHGVPIPDALARMDWKYNGIGNIHDEAVFEFKPADETGYVVFRKPPSVPSYSAPTMNALQVTITGAEVKQFSGPFFPSTIQLEREELAFEEHVANKAVDLNGTVDERAWVGIELEDWTVEGNGSTGGMAEVHAREWIHLTGESHLQAGSTVHLHLEPVFADCDAETYRSTVVPSPTPTQATLAPIALPQDRIQLQFLLPDLRVEVFPNPYTGSFNLSTSQDGVCTLLDARGVVLETWPVRAGTSFHSTPGLAPGLYFFRFTAGDQVRTLPLTQLP